MNMIATIVRPLLEALRNAAGPDEADAFEREFDARDWQLDVSDQMKLLARLQALAEAPPVEPQPAEVPGTRPDTPAHRPPPALAPVPARFAPFAGLAPWVERLPRKWAFVEAVHAVLDAPTFSALADAVRNLFVDGLGYEGTNLDETHRVATQTTVTRVRVVAQHDDFFVVVVESKYGGPHVSSFEPIFQLHPRAIIFALECGERVRVVARRVDSGHSMLIGQRIVRGRGRRAFPDDDLFVWCGRLSQLEPKVGDDGRGMARRADEAVRGTARRVVDAWATAPLSPPQIPGAPWERSAREELTRFFQASAEDRLVFGLEAEFRSSLHWSTRNRAVSLRYCGYCVTRIQGDAWTAEASGQTLDAEILLRLELSLPDREFELLEIPCVISVPDEHGVFVLRGNARVFCPRLGAGLAQDDDSGFDDDDDDLETVPDEELDDDLDAADPGVGLDLEKDPPAGVYANEGLTPLLRWVVGRKLRMLGAKFSSTPSERFSSPGAVLAWLGRYADAGGRVQLVARSVLWTYLRPRRGAHRTIGVGDPAALPPAWACLEIAPHLEVGQMAPVAGARIGPGGVIAAPLAMDDGSVTLTSAEQVHPRLGDAPPVDTAGLWVCSALEPFAGVPVGSLEQPLAILEGGTRSQLRAFACPENPDVLTLDAADALRQRVVRRWTFDVPRHLGARARMESDVQPGQTIREGDLLAHVDSGWTDVNFERHDLVRVGAAVRMRSTKPPSTDQSVVEARCPPSLRGLVESIEVTTIRDLRGRPVRERLAVVVSHHTRFTQAVLPDGRAVPIRYVPAENLPFDSTDGSRADAVLGPSRGLSETDGDESSTSWRSGTSGAPVSGAVQDIEVWLVPPPEPRLPDPCLPARALDGWGLPRSAHDPQLTVGALRRLLVRQPAQAGAVMHRLHKWTGSPWATTSLFDLSRACHLPPPPSVPADWALAEEERGAAPYDPLRTQIHRSSAAPYRVDMGPWEWACDCGQLSKARHAQLPCAECGTTVKRRWVGLPHRSQPLALPVLHPWRIELTAALLGLAADELQQLARTEDCSPLYALTEVALEEPTRSLTRRLMDAEPPAVVDLQRQLQLVEDALLRGIRLDDLWIRELTLLSPRLLFDGYRAGAPDLTSSPLTERYRKIEGLTSFGAHEPESPMRRATWVELQKAVCDLFGDPSGTPESGTLASLWTRLWPTTCHPSIPISVPGLFESVGGPDLRNSLVAKLMGSDVKADEPCHPMGLMGAEGVEALDVPALPRTDVRDERAWKQRAALAECWNARLPALAALCLGIDEKPSIVASLRGMDGADVLEGCGSTGIVVLRELFRLLERPEASPDSLLGLLTSTPPLALPRARDEALSKLDTRLQEALPGEGFATRFVREALLRALSGFWVGTPTPEHPDRWVWTQLSNSAPQGFRRIVPTLGSSAWLVWPGVKMLCAPILAALEGWESGRTAGHAAWLGLDMPDLPPDVPLAESPVPPQPETHEQPVAALDEIAGAPVETIDEIPESEPAPAALVRVLDTTLDVWMKRQLRSDVHAQ